MKNNNLYSANIHKSVLINEVLFYLQIKPGGTYLDATFGGGGHSRAILESEPTCKVIGLDWDIKAIDFAQKEFDFYLKSNRLKLICGNFLHLERIFKRENIGVIDGVLADFGTSQNQIFNKEGFSFSADSKLDMRMSSSDVKITAFEVINYYPEKKLAQIFSEYGEEPMGKASRIAREIATYRAKKRFSSTKEFADFIVNVKKEPKKFSHPATKVFQALRIEINKELENIEFFLASLKKILTINSRFVCISFHSLEDRIVKHFLKDNKNYFSVLTKKPVCSSSEELEKNRSARSAKLRAAIKII